MSFLKKVKVIDMTGKEQRILSGYHAIGAQKMLPDDDVDVDASSRSVVNFDLPELRHNIDMLMDRCEEELINADRKLKHNRNNVEVLQVRNVTFAQVCSIHSKISSVGLEAEWIRSFVEKYLCLLQRTDFD